MNVIEVIRGDRYDGNMTAMSGDFMDMINYIWGLNCCMSTAKEWTEKNGGDTALIEEALLMKESTAIRVYLRKYGCIGQAYNKVLTACGWTWMDQDDYESEDGDLGIIDGEFIYSKNGGLHYVRDLIQVLAFKDDGEWWIWTPTGLDPVDWRKSNADIRQVLTWLPSH